MDASELTTVPQKNLSETSSTGPKRGACYFSLDVNTANNYVDLSSDKKRATKELQSQSYPPNPDRFDAVAQVLCSQPLMRNSRCHVEVKCSKALIAVTSKSIKRKGSGDDVIFGNNAKSWSLMYNQNGLCFDSHNKERRELRNPSGTHVMVLWDGDILSFLDVTPGCSPVHWSRFSLLSYDEDELYIGFGLPEPDSSASLTGVYSLPAVQQWALQRTHNESDTDIQANNKRR